MYLAGAAVFGGVARSAGARCRCCVTTDSVCAHWCTAATGGEGSRRSAAASPIRRPLPLSWRTPMSWCRCHHQGRPGDLLRGQHRRHLKILEPAARPTSSSSSSWAAMPRRDLALSQPIPINETHPKAAYPTYYAFTKVIEEVMTEQYAISMASPRRSCAPPGSSRMMTCCATSLCWRM